MADLTPQGVDENLAVMAMDVARSELARLQAAVSTLKVTKRDLDSGVEQLRKKRADITRGLSEELEHGKERQREVTVALQESNEELKATNAALQTAETRRKRLQTHVDGLDAEVSALELRARTAREALLDEERGQTRLHEVHAAIDTAGAAHDEVLASVETARQKQAQLGEETTRALAALNARESQVEAREGELALRTAQATQREEAVKREAAAQATRTKELGRIDSEQRTRERDLVEREQTLRQAKSELARERTEQGQERQVIDRLVETQRAERQTLASDRAALEAVQRKVVATQETFATMHEDLRTRAAAVIEAERVLAEKVAAVGEREEVLRATSLRMSEASVRLKALVARNKLEGAGIDVPAVPEA